MLKFSRILHVVSSMDPKMGGVCQAIRLTIKGLSSYGIHNEVVSLDSEEQKFNDTFLLHQIGMGTGPWQYNKHLVKWLVNNISRFDIVIVHGIWSYHSHAVAKVVIKMQSNKLSALDKSLGNSQPNLRFFVMPHGMLDPYLQRAKSRRLKAIRNWFYWKTIESKVINNADGLLFTCEQERLLAHEPYKPYLPKKEKVVGLGVDTPPLYTNSMLNAFFQKCPAIENSKYLLFLSRIHEKKGVDILINAYEKLLADHPGCKNLKLVIAGPGLDTSYGKRMQKIVAGSPLLQTQVFFCGMLMNEAKWGAFYNCEAFILPSHQENFGIAVVEALACCKPVLISDQINIWREIDQSGGGIVNSDTEAGTFQSLQKWINFTEAGKKLMGKNAHEAYVKYFTSESATNFFVDALNL